MKFTEVIGHASIKSRLVRTVRDNRISHAHNMTRHRWLPNLQKIRFEQDGKVVRGYVCTRCIRTGSVKKVV